MVYKYIIAAYLGFGLGQTGRMIYDKNIPIFRDKKLTTSLQLSLFIMGFAFLWPLRFFNPIAKYFKIKDKRSGKIIPM